MTAAAGSATAAAPGAAAIAPILEVRAFRIRRGGVDVLNLPYLAVSPGETLSLIGPNGAGKSTLLLGISGIEQPDAGELLFRGERVPAGAAALAYRRRVAMVFQEPLLFDTTVFENVAAGLRLRKLSGEEIRRRTAQSLERFRIGHLSGRSARTLSGGEAQRTSIARAMAVAPEILLLDEPFAALDPPAREALLEDLAHTLRETGTTTIFATHDRADAQRLADRVAVLDCGRLRQIGTVADVLRRPADAFVASFVGVENLLPVRLASTDMGEGGAIAAVLDIRGPSGGGLRSDKWDRGTNVAVLDNSDASEEPADSGFHGANCLAAVPDGCGASEGSTTTGCVFLEIGAAAPGMRVGAEGLLCVRPEDVLVMAPGVPVPVFSFAASVLPEDLSVMAQGVRFPACSYNMAAADDMHTLSGSGFQPLTCALRTGGGISSAEGIAADLADVLVPAPKKAGILNERVHPGWKGLDGETIHGGNRLRGNVTAVVTQGPFVKVVIDCGLRIVAAVSGNLVRDLALQPGSAVTIVLRPADLYVIPKG